MTSLHLQVSFPDGGAASRRAAGRFSLKFLSELAIRSPYPEAVSPEMERMEASRRGPKTVAPDKESKL
jgi:hypothetical protein